MTYGTSRVVQSQIPQVTMPDRCSDRSWRSTAGYPDIKIVVGAEDNLPDSVAVRFDADLRPEILRARLVE
jgi:hypothetical protein